MASLRGVMSRVIVLILGVFVGTLAVVKTLFDVVKIGPSQAFGRKKRTVPPTCLEDPSLGSHGYAHLEEIRMHYVGNGAEDKPLMLLVHGFPEFWYSWRHQLREFKDRFRVVAIDLRGYGDSDRPSGISEYTVPKLVNDLKQIITALGYQHCVLVGHDWGGALCWAFAEKHPDMISHLVVCNCPHRKAFEKYIQSNPKQLLMSWYMFLFQLPFLPEFLLRFNNFDVLEKLMIGKDTGVQTEYTTTEDVEAYKYNFTRNGFIGPVNYYRAAFSLDTLSVDPDETEGDGSVPMPTLIIWGDQDKSVATELAEASARMMCTGRAVVKHVQGASHWVQMDRPDIVNRHIREFLANE